MAAAQIGLMVLLLAGFVYLAFACRAARAELRRLRRRHRRVRDETRELQSSVDFAHDSIDGLAKLVRRLANGATTNQEPKS